MIFREATKHDISQMKVVRNAVKENVLSNAALATDHKYEEQLTVLGKGWVCEIDNQIKGFAIVNLKDKIIWAFFVHPDFEKQGSGRKLHDTMLNWYFSQTTDTLWQSTARNTRAAEFYTQAGWKEIAIVSYTETKFIMPFSDWKEKTADNCPSSNIE